MQLLMAVSQNWASAGVQHRELKGKMQFQWLWMLWLSMVAGNCQLDRCLSDAESFKIGVACRTSTSADRHGTLRRRL